MADIGAEFVATEARPATIPPELILPFAAPISFGGASFSEMRLREPSIAELAEVDQLTGYAWTIAVLAIVANLPTSVVAQLPISLGNEAAGYLMDWISARTGVARPVARPFAH